jgi:hypothetical protein
MKLNPLQQAITENKQELVKELKSSTWSFEKDKYGFYPLEISDFLGFDEIQKLLIIRKPKSVKVQLKNQETPSVITVLEFEKLFNIRYAQTLLFSSYEDLTNTIQNCPYFFRYQWLFGKQDELESEYQRYVLKHLKAKTYIKWIDDVFEYGLFADIDLQPKSFIGEYTGLIREIDKKLPDLNPYCFHYPTKLFSYHYYVIDAETNGNNLRFVNHSDEPNLQPLWLVERGLLHLVFIANQFIPKGTELTFNYGKDYWRKRQKAI